MGTSTASVSRGLFKVAIVTPTNGKRDAHLRLLARWIQEQKLPDWYRLTWSLHSTKVNEAGVALNLFHAAHDARMRHDPDVYVVMEDDDYYPPEYVASVLSDMNVHEETPAVLFGSEETRYYHVKSGGHVHLRHREHASLMATAWSRKACGFVLDTLLDVQGPFVDVALWARARFVNGVIRDCTGAPRAVGLKGWDGYGAGHAANFYTDFDSSDRRVLREWIHAPGHADAILEALT